MGIQVLKREAAGPGIDGVRAAALGGLTAPSTGESCPPSGSHRRVPARAPAATPARASTLRRQVLQIIDEIINNENAVPEARRGLLQRLQGNANRPEEELLALLKDREEQAGLHS
jgi:hypothetical protein